MMSTTVVVIAYYGDRWLPACLQSLAMASRNRLRLVLLDNAGNTCIDSLDLSRFESTILRASRPLGFSEANNVALRDAGFPTRYVCFLNQDTVSGEGWIDACLQVMQGCPEIGAASPLLYASDGKRWDPGFWECAGKLLPLGGLSREPIAPEGWYEAPTATAAALIVRSEVLQKVGPFDPLFGSYYEDYDLCRRIRANGNKIAICTGGRVDHWAGSATSTPEADRRRIRQILRNRVIDRVRSAGRRRLSALAGYLGRDFVFNLGRSLVRTPSSQPLREYLAAHADLFWLAPRLVSERKDARAWCDYLHMIGWQGHAPLDRASSASDLTDVP